MLLVAVATALSLLGSERSAAPFSLPTTWIESQLPWISVVWMLGVGGLSLRLAGGWFLVNRLKRLAVPVHAALQSRVDVLKQRLGVHRPVRVFRSALVRVPMVVGWFKPIILIPGSLVLGIPAVELEALLSHELGHIRRYDYLVNGLQTLIETAFFFHPAVWWVSKQVRIEREHCCDDVALSTADKVTYTRALLELEELKGAGLTFTFNEVSLGADGGHLVNRIRRLVSAAESQGSNASKLLSAAVLSAIWMSSVPMREAGSAPMISLEPLVDPLAVAVRMDTESEHITRLQVLAGPVLEVTSVSDAAELKSDRNTHTREPEVSAALTDDTVRDESVEPAPPVARRGRDSARNHRLPAFVSSSRPSNRVDREYSDRRFGIGLSGGVIQSSTIGPLSPNMEVRAMFVLDPLTQIEAGLGFSMFLHENIFAYTDAEGAQVQLASNYEQQIQISLGFRRGFDKERLVGLYYGLAGGLMQLPIHRLIGDADKTQDAYESKTGYFFLPKVGYVSKANAPFSFDLSAGLSFSKTNGVEFVQPVVSLGINYWK